MIFLVEWPEVISFSLASSYKINKNVFFIFFPLFFVSFSFVIYVAFFLLNNTLPLVMLLLPYCRCCCCLFIAVALKSFSSTRVSISIESMGSSIERNNTWSDGRRRRHCVNMPSYWW